MVFFIYQLGVVATTLAINEVIKKDIPDVIKVRIIMLLIMTSWVGLIAYYLYFKHKVDSWWGAKRLH